MILKTILLLTLIFWLNLQNVISEKLELLLLHSHDIHGRFDETDVRTEICTPKDKQDNKCYGGFGRLAHVIREARNASEEGTGPNVIYLNAGDTYTGTTWFTMHKWKIAAELLNALGVDAASFGNHELDQGVEGLLPFVKAVNFPIVAANLDLSNEPLLKTTKVSRSTILDVSGHRIGVIGYLTPETTVLTQITNIVFNDEIPSIIEESEKLNAEGVKIIIALGHSGFEVDKKIAAEVPLVDVVVGGHTNTFLWNGEQPSTEEIEGPYPTVVEQVSGKKVPVVQVFAYTKYLGRLNLVFDDEGNAIEYSGQPVLLDSSVPQDQDILEVLDKYRPEVEALDRVLGRSKIVFTGDCMKCRTQECNLGNMVADSFVAHHAYLYNGPYWTDTPIAFLNAGALRRNIEPNVHDGTITKTHVVGAVPFDGEVISMSLNGTDLLEALEVGARGIGETTGGELLQVSGIRYEIDMTKPVGNRIVRARARCAECTSPSYEDIVPEKTYKVLTTAFISNGGDGHLGISENGFDKVTESLGIIDTMAWFVEYYQNIYQEEEDRLVVIHGEMKPDC